MPANTEETRIYYPTVPELAVTALRNKDYEKGLPYVTKAIEAEGWQVRFHDEPNRESASFSRKDGKVIDINRNTLTAPRSTKHLIASLVHEYLYGELTDEASNNASPRDYMRAHFREFANLDVEVAGALDEEGNSSMTGVILLSHRRNNYKTELSEAEITRLLEK